MMSNNPTETAEGFSEKLERLSVEQVIQIMLRDQWEQDRHRPALLTEEEREAINAYFSRLDPDEASFLVGSWKQTYLETWLTIQEAQLRAHDIVDAVSSIVDLLNFSLHTAMAKQAHFFQPVILTQEQYDRLKPQQRDRLMRSIHSIQGVLEERASRLATEEQKALSGDEAETLIAEFPELLGRAAGEVLEAIQQNRLQPVRITDKELEKVKRVNEQILALLQKDLLRAPKATAELNKRAHELEWEAYLRAQNKDQEQTRKQVVQWLEQLQREPGRPTVYLWEDVEQLKAEGRAQNMRLNLQGGLFVDQEAEAGRQLLKEAYVTGQELYRLGWPEWLAWIDGLNDLLDPDLGGWAYAVIQNPREGLVDEHGNYEDFASSILEELAQERIEIDPELIDAKLEAVKAAYRAYLAGLYVIEEVSQRAGVDFTEALDRYTSYIQERADQYNGLLKSWKGLERRLDIKVNGEPKSVTLFALDYDPPTFSLSRFKADKQAITFFRERLEGLGEKWWRGPKLDPGLLLSELQSRLDAPEDVPND